MTFAGRVIGLVGVTALATGCGLQGSATSDADEESAESVAEAAGAIVEKAAGGEWREPNIAGCAIGAVSIEDDIAGLNVRAEPSGSSAVIGKLHSLVEAPPNERPLPTDPMVGPYFTIIKVEGDWLQIADISPVTGGFDPRTHNYREVQNFQGVGWIHQRKVDVFSGYWDKAYDRPYHQPGPWKSVDDDAGINLYNWNKHVASRPQILECEMDWVKLRYERLGARVSGPENVRYFSEAERSRLAPVVAWLKSTSSYAGTAPCDRADPDCPARRAHDWD